jgi:hypothetical protein
MSLTKLPLGRNNSVMTSLFPPRESLVVTSWLGTGNFRTFFYGVAHLNVRILSLISFPFTLTTMQVPNLALVETGQIAVPVVFIEPKAKDRPPEYKNTKKSLSSSVWAFAEWS